MREWTKWWRTSFSFAALPLNPERKHMPEDTRPATRQDINELREQMNGQITEIRGQITAVRDQLVEQMRDMQTEVLRAFHDWA